MTSLTGWPIAVAVRERPERSWALKPIITLTMNPAVDISAEAEQVSPTRKVRCTSVRRDPGGGGINVARVIRTLGGQAIALYAAGGTSGKLIEELVKREKVDQDPIPIQGFTRESFTVLDRSSGNQFRFVFSGPELSDNEWQECLDHLFALDHTPEYIVASGSLPRGVPSDFYARVARFAKKEGARLVLDTSGEALRTALEEGVYLVKPNLRELQDLTGCRADNVAEQQALTRDLVANNNAEVVALTLGGEGALLTWRGGCEYVAPPKVEPQSAVGAGDSFVGGFTLAIARDRSLMDAFRFGIAAGTAALLTPGTELCHRADVERLHAKILVDAR